MALYSNIGINTIKFENKGTTPSPYDETILTDNGKTVSIMGPSKKGKAFYPQGYTSYPNFAESSGDIFTHYKEYQGRINSNFAAYSALTSGGQVNYTRLLGLNHDSFIGKPGFKIGEAGSLTNRIYVFGAEFEKKDNDDLTRFNYAMLEGLTDMSGVYKLKVGFLITKPGITINITNDYNKYEDTTDSNDVNLRLYSLKLTGMPGDSVDTVIPQNDDIVLDVLNITQKIPEKIYFNFDKTSEYYFERVLNKNIHRLDEFGYVLYSFEDINDEFFYCIKNDETDQANNLKYFTEELETDDYKDFNKEYTHATSPWFVSQGFYLENETDDRSNLKDRIVKLFRVHSITDGESGNDYFIKIVPNNLGDDNQWASFGLYIYDRNSNSPLESFPSLNLKESDENYILRKIGDYQNYFDANGSERIVNKGLYSRISKYIWIEVSKDVEMQNIAKETIPCGFIEKRKYKNTPNIDLQSTNHHIPAILFDASTNKISVNHSWGHNIFNLNGDKQYSSYRLETLSNIQNVDNTTFSTLSSDRIFKVLKQNNQFPFKKSKEKYLPGFYFQDLDLNSSLSNEDIFHLEKITLFNVKNDNTTRQCWELSTYDRKGTILNNLDTNSKYFNELDINIDIAPGNHPFYYYQLSRQKNFINEDKSIDSIEILGSNQNYISFVAEMSGGFDGLNIFDIDQVAMTQKGIENNSYIRELYQYGLEIMSSREQCLNDIIHLCGIFDEEIQSSINRKLDENDYRSKPVYILDKPFYDDNENIIDCHQMLQRSQNNPDYKWSDFVFSYSSTQGNLINFNNCLQYWQRKINDSSYISSFANYINVEIINGGGLGFDNDKIYDIFIPASVLAVRRILSENLTLNITDNENALTDIEGNNITQVLNRLDENDTKFEYLKKEYVRYTTNIAIASKDINVGLKFCTSKTNAFIDNSNNQSLRSLLLVRLILNEIKRNAANLGIRSVFGDVKSKKETILRYNQLYTSLMNSIVATGIIKDYQLKLDEYSTSEDDLLNNIIRGEIFVEFNGQNIFATNDQPSKITVKI
jgi:ribosomal protein L31